MAVLKGVIFILFVLPILSGLHFLAGLYVGEDDFIFTSFMLILTCITLFIIGIVGLIRPFKYLLNKRSRNTTAIILSVLLLTSSVVSLLIYMSIYEIDRFVKGEEARSLTSDDKLEYMKQLYVKITNQEYNLDAMSNKKVDHITFYYEKDYDPDRLINLTMETLESYETDINNLFGDLEHEHVSIIFYNDYERLQSYLDIPAEGKWAGFYNPGSKTIHLDVPPMEELDEQQMRQTIIHEYSHHLLSTFLNEHNINTIPPEWFYEGVAGYLEKKNSIIYEEELVNIQYLSFSHLDTQSEWDEGLQSPFSPYLQSYLFINYLIEDKGINVVSTILLNSKKETFLDGFELTVGKTLSEYEEPFFEKLSSIEALFKSALSMRLNQDNSDGALHTLFEIISVVPNHNLANHNIANIYFDNGDYEKAIEYRKKVVNLDPEYAPSYTYLSTTLLFFDVEEALEVEKIGLEYAKRYGEGINFSQSRIEDLSYIIKSKQEGNAYKGYLKIIKEDDFWYMKDKNKVDLIKLVLQQSPEVDTPEKRELISILNQLEKVN